MRLRARRRQGQQSPKVPLRWQMTLKHTPCPKTFRHLVPIPVAVLVILSLMYLTGESYPIFLCEPMRRLNRFLHGKTRQIQHIQAKRDRKVREAKARNHARSISLTADCKLSRRLRKRSEHIFAEAKQQHGMGRARYRGLASLNEQLNLVAAVQNLKRLVSFIRRGKASMCALSVKDSASCSSNSSYSLLTRTLIRLFCLFHSKTIRYATL